MPLALQWKGLSKCHTPWPSNPYTMSVVHAWFQWTVMVIMYTFMQSLRSCVPQITISGTCSPWPHRLTTMWTACVYDDDTIKHDNNALGG